MTTGKLMILLKEWCIDIDYWNWGLLLTTGMFLIQETCMRSILTTLIELIWLTGMGLIVNTVMEMKQITGMELKLTTGKDLIPTA